MRIVTFNVNGIRAIRDYYRALGITFDAFLASTLSNADIVCMQEHKTNERCRLDDELRGPAEYTAYYAFPKKPRLHGYSGVVTFVSRRGTVDGKPLMVRQVEYGITGVYSAGDADTVIDELSCEPLHQHYTEDELRELDGEARTVILDLGPFLLLNIYFPNDGGSERDSFRMSFYDAVRLRCEGLVKGGRSLIIVGDINTTGHPRDHCDYVHPYLRWAEEVTHAAASELIHRHLAEAGRVAIPDPIRDFYSNPSRRWLYRLLHSHAFVDVFRRLHPDRDFAFTCWNTKIAARGTNYGTRIDGIWVVGSLFVSSSASEDNGRLQIVSGCDILPAVMGSDHCPVYCILDDSLLMPLLCASASVGMTGNKAKRKAGGSESLRQTRLSSFFGVKEPAEGKACLQRDADHSSQPAQANAESPLSPLPAPEKRARKADVSPLCRGHDEPCKRMRVNKAGPNRGRYFWACARPVMGQDEPLLLKYVGKSAVTQYKCDFFAWDD